MANEARVFAEGTEQVVVRQFTVADGTAIPKGTLLINSGTEGSRTGVAHGTNPLVYPLGYTTSSKEANDGITEIGVQRTSAVDAVADGTWVTGEILGPGATANTLRAIRGFTPSDYVNLGIGGFRALENATNGQTRKAACILG